MQKGQLATNNANIKKVVKTVVKNLQKLNTSVVESRTWIILIACAF